MLLSRRRRRLSGAASIGVSALLGLATLGCGGSSLKAPKTDAQSDGTEAGGHIEQDAQGPGGAMGTGGGMATGGATPMAGTGGASGRATGGALPTGGQSAAGGATGLGGAAGGTPRRGGSVGLGGLPVRGGTTGTGIGGSPARGGSSGSANGGTSSMGGKPASGGTTSTGGALVGSGGRAGTGGSTAGGTGAAMLAPLIDAFCKAARSCCASSTFSTAGLVDCEAKYPSRLQYAPLVDKGTVSVDPSALAACVTAYTNVASTCTSTELAAACTGIFVGAQAEGQPCGGATRFGSYECQPAFGSASCYWQDSTGYPSQAGVCIAIPPGKAGDLCSRTCLTNQTCVVDMLGGAAPFPVTCFEADGLYCSVASNPAVCKPILQLGEACSWDIGSCGSGNYCHWTNSTCQPTSKLGESCSSALCADELTCGGNHRCIETSFVSETVCSGIPSVP